MPLDLGQVKVDAVVHPLVLSCESNPCLAVSCMGKTTSIPFGQPVVRPLLGKVIYESLGGIDYMEIR